MQYVATYSIHNRVIELTCDENRKLESFSPNKKYLVKILEFGDTHVLDLSMLLAYEPNITKYSTLKELLENSISDKFLIRYKSDKLPEKDLITGKYNNRIRSVDLHQIGSGSNVAYVDIRYPETRNDIYTRASCRDLVVTYNNKDALKNIIPTVNGIVHPHVYFENELFVQHGFLSMLYNKQNAFCGIDTSSLGGHTWVPMTRQMAQERKNLTTTIHVKMPENISLKGTTPAIVINGFLHILDGTYEVVNKDTICIDMNKLDLVNNYVHHPMIKFHPGAIDINSTSAEVIVGDPLSGSGNTSSILGVEPSTSEKIHYSMLNYKKVVKEELASLIDYDYSDLFLEYQRLTQRILTTDNIFNDDYFINTLTNPYSGIILIHNDNLYKREYSFVYDYRVSQYLHHGTDTPRGIGFYNNDYVVPYTRLSSRDWNIHRFSVELSKDFDDAYKTYKQNYILNEPSDIKRKTKHSLKLLELYCK